jgi:lisH domain-containing protein FOPNL
MSKEEDILNVVKEALEGKGVLSTMKARIRAEIFHTLDDKSVQMPKKPKDVYLANEIIRDYLSCMKLDSTLSVLSDEIGESSNEKGVDREFLGGELGFNTIGCDKETPLLMLLIQFYIKHKQDKELSDLASFSSTT